MKIERAPNLDRYVWRTLGELNPGDVFWQKQYGKDTLYVVVSTGANTCPAGFGSNEWQTHEGEGFVDVLVVRLCGEKFNNTCPHLCQFPAFSPVTLVDATLAISERQ